MPSSKHGGTPPNPAVLLPKAVGGPTRSQKAANAWAAQMTKLRSETPSPSPISRTAPLAGAQAARSGIAATSGRHTAVAGAQIPSTAELMLLEPMEVLRERLGDHIRDHGFLFLAWQCLKHSLHTCQLSNCMTQLAMARKCLKLAWTAGVDDSRNVALSFTYFSVKFAGANGVAVSRGSAQASRATTPPVRVSAPAVERAQGAARGVSAPPSSSKSRLAPTAAPHKPRPLVDLAGKDLSKLPEWQRRLLENKLKVSVACGLRRWCDCLTC